MTILFRILLLLLVLEPGSAYPCAAPTRAVVSAPVQDSSDRGQLPAARLEVTLRQTPRLPRATESSATEDAGGSDGECLAALRRGSLRIDLRSHGFAVTPDDHLAPPATTQQPTW